MKHNPVAKFAHLYNVCKVIDTKSKDVMFLVSSFTTDGTFAESEVFDTLEAAQDFQKELTAFGFVVSLTLL